MSALRRSASYSNIPRLSRLPIRNSNVSKPPRSSSARSSNVNTNLLTVPGSGTLGRASSYTNLVTPIGRRQCSTPSSAASSISKDSRLHDKDWQKCQLSRVKMFFHGVTPEVILKPLTIRMYVRTMDILLKQLDNRISITLENYKDSVPDYLKSFKYPYNLKPSIAKTPSVPSSWVYILQIWTWLLDLIDNLQNPECVLSPLVDDGESMKFANHGLYYMAERFVSFNKEHEKEEDVDKQFLSQMAQRMDVDVNNIKQYEEEEMYIDKELENIRAAHSTAELSAKEMSHKVLHLRKENSTQIQKKYDERNKLQGHLKELMIKSKNLKASITEKENEAEKLETIVCEQTHTKEDLIEIKNKIQAACNLEKYKNVCRKELASKIEEYDAKLNYQKQEFNSTVYQINNKIIPLICEAPELRGLKMSEEILSESNPGVYIAKFNEQMKKLNIDINMKSKHLQERCKTLEEDNKKVIAKLEALELELNKFPEMERENECAFDKNCQVYKKQSDKEHLKIAELQQKCTDLVASAPDIDLLKKKLEGYVRKEAELQSLGEEMLCAGEDLFITVHNNIKSLMETEKAMMYHIEDYLENAFKLDVTDLDAAISTLKKKMNLLF